MAKFIGSKAKGATPRKATDGMSLFAAMLIGGVLTLAIGFFLYLWNPFNQGKTASAADTPAMNTKITKANSSNANYEFYDLLPEQKTTGLPTQAIGDRAEEAAKPSITPDVVIDATTSPTPDTSQKGDNSATAKNTQTKSQATTSGDTPQPAQDATTLVKNPLDNENKDSNSHNEQVDNASIGKGSIGLVETNRRFILQINSFKTAEEADKRRAQVLIAGVDAQIVKKGLSDGTIIYQVISRPMVSEQAVAEAQNRLQDNGIDSLIVEQRTN